MSIKMPRVNSALLPNYRGSYIFLRYLPVDAALHHNGAPGMRGQAYYVMDSLAASHRLFSDGLVDIQLIVFTITPQMAEQSD